MITCTSYPNWNETPDDLDNNYQKNDLPNKMTPLGPLGVAVVPCAIKGAKVIKRTSPYDDETIKIIID